MLLESRTLTRLQNSANLCPLGSVLFLTLADSPNRWFSTAELWKACGTCQGRTAAYAQLLRLRRLRLIELDSSDRKNFRWRYRHVGEELAKLQPTL